MTLIEAAKQALDALYMANTRERPEIGAAINALSAAIEQAEKQEPVAWNSGVPPLYPQIKDGETISVEYVEAISPAAPVQVSPADFINMVMDKEDVIGKPIYWAEWPNREKNT